MVTLGELSQRSNIIPAAGGFAVSVTVLLYICSLGDAEPL